MDLVILVFGILWIIKGEIRIHKSPFWDERRIDASTGRVLGLIMVVGFLILLCAQSVGVSRGINAACILILAILPIFAGIVASEKVVKEVPRTESDDERAWLWRARLAETDSERMRWYRQVLTINPDNEEAKSQLAALQSRD